jgi:hypothetical protein
MTPTVLQSTSMSMGACSGVTVNIFRRNHSSTGCGERPSIFSAENGRSGNNNLRFVDVSRCAVHGLSVIVENEPQRIGRILMVSIPE